MIKINQNRVESLIRHIYKSYILGTVFHSHVYIVKKKKFDVKSSIDSNRYLSNIQNKQIFNTKLTERRLLIGICLRGYNVNNSFDMYMSLYGP